MNSMRMLRNKLGQTMIEYGLLVALISIIVLTVLVAIGPQLKAFFNQVLVALGGTAVP